MKKALLIATVEGFFNFEIQDIKILQDLGYEVHLAANSDNVERPIEIEGVVKHHIGFERSPYSKKNYLAYRQLDYLTKQNHFDLIHCHTPVGGVLGRILGHKHKIKTIYTAHGFHFFKGATLKNWMLFYPVEFFLSGWTDILITINQEDYCCAKKFRTKNVKYIPGVGIDGKKFSRYATDVERNVLKEKYGLNKDDSIVLSVGELCDRKNHRVMIKAIAQLNNENVKYVICGQGDKEKELKQLVKELKVEDKVLFMGYQKNINEFLQLADLYAFPSLQEGLPVALMEAMANGLPIVASKIRGNTDLIEDGKNGYLVSANESKEFCEKISFLLQHPEVCTEMRIQNLEIIKNFDSEVVKGKMKQIYGNLDE